MTVVPYPITASDDWNDLAAENTHEASRSVPESRPPPTPIPSTPNVHTPVSEENPTLLHSLNQSNPSATTPPNPPQPLQGFDTLDEVQRYALGAVAVVLLNLHATDLNGAAFARSQAATILVALGLRPGQQTALLELEPDAEERTALIEECYCLVGDEAARFCAVQAMLALAVARGIYDARSRAFLNAIASAFNIPWRTVAAVELAVAAQLFEQSVAEVDEAETAQMEGEGRVNAEHEDVSEGAVTPLGAKTVDQLLIERRKKKMRVAKAMKITGITLAGGLVFGLTGGLIAPALLSALAGVGVASAAGLAASGSVASASVVGGLFGVAGAGFTVKKARHRVSTNLDEFDFERADDPRVVEGRKRRAEREQKKLEKLIAARLREKAEMNGHLAIESGQPASKEQGVDAVDIEKELPGPSTSSEGEEEYDDIENGSKKYRWGKKKKKIVKVKVGSRGLEAASLIPSLHICICVPAWLNDRTFGSALDQFEAALKKELPCSQHIALRWESRRLYEMGLAFAKFWASKATVTTVQQAYPHAVAAASTVAGAVAFAFAMPLTVMSCMDYVDNPWSILVSRSNGAGDELADVLVERSYGQRPVTLFGYSIGARVVFKCLESLATRGALGIVDNVFLMGAAVTADPERWKRIRSVVAGRIVNAYGSYDWALAFFHRGCGHGLYVSGLRRIELEGVENLNMAYLGIEGHRELKDCVPRVMKAMGLGVGYIVMPPARLARKRDRTRGRKGVDPGELLTCEGHERFSTREKDDIEDISSLAIEGDCSPNLNDMRSKSARIPDSLNHEERAGRLEIDEELALPPNLEGQQPVGELQIQVEEHEFSTEIVGESVEERYGKKKSKSWLSWNSWGASGRKHRHKSKSRKSEHKTTDTETDLQGMSPEVPSIDSDVIFEDKETSIQERHDKVSEDIEAYEGGQRYTEESGKVEEEGLHANHDLTPVERAEAEEGVESFDWEKQRRIWEEQERQIQERGYADSAAEIEMRNKIVLGIGIEVAGRRICRFLEQDAELPVAKKEEIFTNCVEDQRGVVVRIYEHEKQTKSVSLNVLKHDEEYPRLVGELELKLRAAAEKGKLRIAVGLWATEGGDIWAEAEERFVDGGVGERSETMVPRAELCTIAERTRLEAAERKRIEAQLQKEMRNRAQGDMLALPAGVSEDVEKQEKERVSESESAEKKDGQFEREESKAGGSEADR